MRSSGYSSIIAISTFQTNFDLGVILLPVLEGSKSWVDLNKDQASKVVCGLSTKHSNYFTILATIFISL